MCLGAVPRVAPVVLMGLPVSTSRPDVLTLALASAGRSLASILEDAGSSSDVLSSRLIRLSALAGEMACAAAIARFLPICWVLIPRGA